ncbi:MAG: hypothetical protein BIFFINMI_01360 [Phycisphaerae bacterium]|nr:hypothetical protein [Phycisphaerae bacterium]
MTHAVSAVRQSVAADQAAAIVQARCGEFTASVRRRVYYPFHCFRFDGSARVLLWRRRLIAWCMVDLINAQAATCDPFEREQADVDERDVLRPTIDAGRARGLAEACIHHAFIHRTRSLAMPRFELVEQHPVHVPFWIVVCTHPRHDAFEAVVNAATGGYQLL